MPNETDLTAEDFTTQTQHETLVNLAMAMYVDEPCRICGKMINPGDLRKLKWAGYSACNTSRSAHNQCWQEDKPKSEWAYPQDSL